MPPMNRTIYEMKRIYCVYTFSYKARWLWENREQKHKLDPAGGLKHDGKNCEPIKMCILSKLFHKRCYITACGKWVFTGSSLLVANILQKSRIE